MYGEQHTNPREFLAYRVARLAAHSIPKLTTALKGGTSGGALTLFGNAG